MGPRKCEVCKEAQSKYKCPSCLVPYCSLACFKKHKENPCKKSPTPAENLTTVTLAKKKCEVDETDSVLNKEELLSIATVLPKEPFEVEESDWVLNEEELISIVKSTEIREALQDRELRNLIHKIDCSENPEDLLDKAMEGQAFHDFTEKILSIVSPQE